MPRHSYRSRVKCDYSSRFDAAAAQQEIMGAGTAVMRLRLGDREDASPQLRFLKPARNRSLEDARPTLPEPPPGDHEHATPSCGPRRRDESKEGSMRLGLGHSVQIEACLYPVQTALQSFSGSAVDPGKTIERRHVGWGRHASLHLTPGNHHPPGLPSTI